MADVTVASQSPPVTGARSLNKTASRFDVRAEKRPGPTGAAATAIKGNNYCQQAHRADPRVRGRRRRQRGGGRAAASDNWNCFPGIGSMRRLAAVCVLLPELVPLVARTGGDNDSSSSSRWRWGNNGGSSRLAAAMAYPSQTVGGAGVGDDGHDDGSQSRRRNQQQRPRSGAGAGAGGGGAPMLRRRAESTEADERQYLEGGFNFPPGLGMNRIINGNDVLNQFRRPYAVNLGCCSGSLIAPDVVLTAAHCAECIQDYPVRVGRYDLFDDNENYEEFNIVETLSHPLYYPLWSQDYDVAVLILDGMSKLRPVVLDGEVVSGKQYDPSDGDNMTVIGWGLTETGDFAQVLQHATIQYDESCGDFQPWITPRMMCAADHISFPIKDACEGDSGAPLLAADACGESIQQGATLQVGVLSWGEQYPCNEPNKPAVYTRVREVHGWIQDEVCGRSNAAVGQLLAQQFECNVKVNENAGLMGGTFLGVAAPVATSGFANGTTLGGGSPVAIGGGIEVVGQLEDLGVTMPLGVEEPEADGEIEVSQEVQQEENGGGGGNNNKKAKNNAKKNKNKQK